jgi:hypothetical protein
MTKGARQMINNDATMKEKADMLRNDQRSTFAQFAQSDADTPRGRFTVHEQSRVIGSSPSPASQYPAGPAWTTDPGSQMLEPPLSPYENPALEPSELAPAFSPLVVQGNVGDLEPSLSPAQETPSPSSQAPPLADKGLGFSQRAYRRF